MVGHQHAGYVCAVYAPQHRTQQFPTASFTPLNNSRNLTALIRWLGITPPDMFVYVFLPPLVLDSAVRMDFFLLKKVGC